MRARVRNLRALERRVATTRSSARPVACSASPRSASGGRHPGLVSAVVGPVKRGCAKRLACQYPTGALRLHLLLRSELPWQLVTSVRLRRTFLTSTLPPERCCFRKLDPTQAVPSQSSPTSAAVTLPLEHLRVFLLRRLRLPLPLTPRTCRCRGMNIDVPVSDARCTEVVARPSRPPIAAARRKRR